jgi:hypothetical protein
MPADRDESAYCDHPQSGRYCGVTCGAGGGRSLADGGSCWVSSVVGLITLGLSRSLT